MAEIATGGMRAHGVQRRCGITMIAFFNTLCSDFCIIIVLRMFCDVLMNTLLLYYFVLLFDNKL